ncbi:MAG TPA: ABC transporter ATP-binding protein [Microterricola sp.]
MTVRRADGTAIVSKLSFDVPDAASLAIIGESGSGKSLTAKALSGLLPEGLSASGTVSFGDLTVDLAAPEAAWRGLRGGTVALLLQDPFTSLSPVHRCGAQIAASIRARGARLGRAELRQAVERSLAEVQLPARVARQYPVELSGGMRQRVAIAAALAANPVLLIADEPTTALDASTQAELLELLGTLQAERAMSVLLISHDLGLVRGRADDVLVVYRGRAMEFGPAQRVLDNPAHPYTAGLRASEPSAEVRLRRIPELAALPLAADTCASGHSDCTPEHPAVTTVEPGWWVSCTDFGGRGLTDTAAELVEDVPVPEPHDVVLRVNAASRSFGGRQALNGVSLVVGRGESVGVVGESGSGKTTLARAIVGLERLDSGSIDFTGRVGAPPNGARGARRRGVRGRDPRTVQIVFQDPYSSLNPSMRIGAMLAEALAVGGRPASDVAELLNTVGLSATMAESRPHQLSGGQRQRVAIARALATDPEVLICDESVSALDVSVQAQILNLLSELRERLNLSILFVSHDLAVIRQITDRVYVMKDGSVIESGATSEILTAPSHPYTRALLRASLHEERTP